MSEHFRFSPRPNRANEIHWRSWGPQAFAEAQAHDKPILLSLSAVWCHWCHVMDETTYSSPDVIATINEKFIPIRVDNDQRPDINARYNMGGWPTTAFLMPTGETITGTTYVPPQQMLELLERVASFYHESKADIREKIAAEALPLLTGVPDDAALSERIVDRVVDAISDFYDAQYGGFGNAPKFPMTDALELLLEHWLRTKEPRLRAMLEKTLRAMADHGMYDHVEGGWFRYSTDREWRVPHFEKMAEDHAGLLRVYSRFARATSDAHLRSRVEGAIRWLMSTLYDERSGLFGGSQDADEVYYAKPLEERRAMQAPYVDRTSYTNWTAGLAGALFETAALLDDASLADRAVRALDVLWDRMHDEINGLLFHVLQPGGKPQVWGLLTDAAAMLRALLDAHVATGESRMLTRAEQLADEVVTSLLSAHGGFYDRAPDAGEALGLLAAPDRPMGDNSSVAGSLLRLAALADRPELHARAEEALMLYARSYEKAGSFAAPYAMAVARAMAPPEVVTIVTDAADGQPLRDAALSLRLHYPLLDVRTLDAARDAQRVARSGYRADGGAVAYVCIGTTCAAPAHAPEELVHAFTALCEARALKS